jgi:hypothetical protein
MPLLDRPHTSETRITLNALAPYIAALHQQDLLEEAEILRRVKLVRGSQPNVPAWRRALGSGARGLSGLFALAARSLDPSVVAKHAEAEHAGPGQDGHGARAMAA